MSYITHVLLEWKQWWRREWRYRWWRRSYTTPGVYQYVTRNTNYTEISTLYWWQITWQEIQTIQRFQPCIDDKLHDKKYKLYRDFNPVLMTNYMTRNTYYTEISTLYWWQITWQEIYIIQRFQICIDDKLHDKKYKLFRDFNPVLMTNYMTRNIYYNRYFDHWLMTNIFFLTGCYTFIIVIHNITHVIDRK
jgi:hypothetical protein